MEKKINKSYVRSPEPPKRPGLSVPVSSAQPPAPVPTSDDQSRCPPQSQLSPALHKALLEVAPESLALVALNLAVLDSLALQVVIHLRGVDGSCPLLILGRVLANPVVDVIGEGTAGLVDLGVGSICVVRPGSPWAPIPFCRISHTLEPWSAVEPRIVAQLTLPMEKSRWLSPIMDLVLIFKINHME